MDFHFYAEATSQEKLKVCERLLTLTERLKSSDYKQGNKDERKALRRQVFLAVGAVMSQEDVTSWIQHYGTSDFVELLIKSKQDLLNEAEKVRSVATESGDKQLQYEAERSLMRLRYGIFHIERGEEKDVTGIETEIEIFQKLAEQLGVEVKTAKAIVDWYALNQREKTIERGSTRYETIDGVSPLLQSMKELMKDRAQENLEKAEKKEIDYVPGAVTDEIKKVREKFKEEKVLTTDEVMAVGEVVFKKVYENVNFADVAKLTQEREDLVVDYNIRAQFMLTEERNKLYDACMAADQKLLDAQQENVEKVSLSLAKLVPLCKASKDELNTLCAGRSKGGKTVHEVLKLLPDTLVRKHLSKPGLAAKFSKRRGHYNLIDDEISTSCSRTTAHELGHRITYISPTIKRLEREFYQRRTAGENPVSLRQLTKKPYGPDEYTLADHFFDPYVGRIYGRDSYEVVSMGFEHIFYEPETMKKDPEYAKLILGILLTL